MTRKRARKRKKATLRAKLVRLFAVLVLVAGGSLAAWEVFVLRLDALRDPAEIRRLEVPSGDGERRQLILGPSNPYWTPLGSVSEMVILCVLKAEDDRFFRHRGFDWKEIRASLVTNLEAGGYSRGGSTLTMQLAKNLFLWRSKSLARKGLEAYLTWRLETTLSKQRILELYLNVVEWGPGVYGIGEASQHYFGKRPSDLTLGESAMLAAILPNPVRWNPNRAPDVARRRQSELLARLRRDEALSALLDPD